MRLGTAQPITNVISSRKASLRFSPANGPPPDSVPHTAKHDRISAAVAVSRGPQRSAPPSRGTMARMLNALRMIDCSISGLKAIRPTATAPSWTIVESRNRLKSNGRYRPVIHRTTTGVTTSAPATLPSHQVNAIAGNRASSADPARTRLPTPRAALTTVPGPTTQECEFRGGARAIERPGAARPDGDEISADDRLECVADCDARGGEELGVEACVGDVVRRIRRQCAGENGRPDPRAAEQNGRQGEAGRRPDRGGAWMDRRQQQAGLGQHEVGRSDDEKVSAVPGQRPRL